MEEIKPGKIKDANLDLCVCASSQIVRDEGYYFHTYSNTREPQNTHANHQPFTRTINHSREQQNIHANHQPFTRTTNIYANSKTFTRTI